MSEFIFPDGFLWGSAVWALGVEGAAERDGRTPTVLDEHYRLHPDRFYDGVGPSETLDWRDRYDQFAQWAQNLGHTSFRTSIQWSRLMPDGTHVSESALQFYRSLFKAFKRRGIELSAVLYWFDMPLVQEDRGGFVRRDIEDDFVAYCHACFELFDGLVDIWYVYNEPTVDTYMKYAWESCYPCRVSWQDVCRATYNMVVAHARVVQVHRDGGYAGRIGTVLAHAHVYPKGSDGLDRLAAAEDACLIHRCFEDPLLAGSMSDQWLDIVNRSGVMLDIREDDERLVRENTIGLLGMNVYMPERVQHAGRGMSASEWMQTSLGADGTHRDPSDRRRPEEENLLCSAPYQWPDARMNDDRGWEIYPRTMYDSLMDIEIRYPGTEVRITENGIGIHDEERFRDASGMIQDDYRIDYLRDHLVWAHRAIQDGCNLTGYNMWSFVDLWSPSNQFKNCYGLLEFNRATGEIREKKSAAWFRAVSRRNCVED